MCLAVFSTNEFERGYWVGAKLVALGPLI